MITNGTMYEPSIFNQKKEMFLLSYEELTQLLENCSSSENRVVKSRCVQLSQVIIRPPSRSSSSSSHIMTRNQATQTDLTCLCHNKNNDNDNDNQNENIVINRNENDNGNRNKNARKEFSILYYHTISLK